MGINLAGWWVVRNRINRGFFRDFFRKKFLESPFSTPVLNPRKPQVLYYHRGAIFQDSTEKSKR